MDLGEAGMDRAEGRGTSLGETVVQCGISMFVVCVLSSFMSSGPAIFGFFLSLHVSRHCCLCFTCSPMRDGPGQEQSVPTDALLQERGRQEAEPDVGRLCPRSRSRLLAELGMDPSLLLRVTGSWTAAQMAYCCFWEMFLRCCLSADEVWAVSASGCEGILQWLHWIRTISQSIYQNVCSFHFKADKTTMNIK